MSRLFKTIHIAKKVRDGILVTSYDSPDSPRLRKVHTSVLIVHVRWLQIASDQDDNKFLECADAARADYLVSANPRHFPKFWESTKAISSREFIDLVAPHPLS